MWERGFSSGDDFSRAVSEAISMRLVDPGLQPRREVPLREGFAVLTQTLSSGVGNQIKPRSSHYAALENGFDRRQELDLNTEL